MKNNFIFCAAMLATLLMTSCNNNEIEMPTGFLENATIVKQSPEIYHCYFDNSENYFVSNSKVLEGVERGYFSFLLDKDEWKEHSTGDWSNITANVSPINVFPIITPMSKEEAEKKGILASENLQVPKNLGIGSAGHGYLDFWGYFDAINLKDSSKNQGKLFIVFDPKEQSADSLFLNIYFNSNILKESEFSSAPSSINSCDISVLSSLQEWNDSVAVVIRTPKEDKFCKNISKKSFLRPMK